jgi:hypothetical protein
VSISEGLRGPSCETAESSWAAVSPSEDISPYLKLNTSRLHDNDRLMLFKEIIAVCH